jgi:hypothetical protein
MSLEDLSVDQLLSVARESKPMADLVKQLSSNPETRTQLQRLMKQANPTLVIPEIDAADKVREEIGQRDEKIAALEQRFLERDVRDRLERSRAAAMSKYGLTDSEMTDAEKTYMLAENAEERVSSHDLAAKLFKASKQQSVPTHSAVAPSVFEMPEKDVWAGGIGNKAKLDQIGLQEAFSAWNEIAGARAN